MEAGGGEGGQGGLGRPSHNYGHAGDTLRHCPGQPVPALTL